MAKKVDYKNIKPILEPKKREAKDPVRFPKVISKFEDKSKRDFTNYLQMEMKMLATEMNKNI